MILANRLRLLVGPEYLGTANAARAVAGVERLPIVAHPVLTREYPDAMLAARSAVDRVVRDAAANANARERFEDLAFRNTLTNLPSLLGEADAGSLAGAFEGRPAIVVGAGPSLDVNVEALRPFQSSCLIVAADTAVVPCVKGGLTPHLAVALNPSLDNARHLTRMAVPASVHLVCEASVDASVPRAFGGRTFFFRVGRHAPWPWLEAAGVRLATLDAWGSVVTSALESGGAGGLLAHHLRRPRSGLHARPELLPPHAARQSLDLAGGCGGPSRRPVGRAPQRAPHRDGTRHRRW